MKLIKVYADTDWKYRASHDVKILAEGSEKKLRALMDKEAQKHILDDLRDDVVENEGEDGDSPRYSKEWMKRFEADSALAAKTWKNDERWEVKLGRKCRFFNGGSDGDSWSISYTIL